MRPPLRSTHWTVPQTAFRLSRRVDGPAAVRKGDRSALPIRQSAGPQLPQPGGIVDRHGSESYFVLGEGLLGESVGGRQETLEVAPATPPFRFSRMGPSGDRPPARRTQSARSSAQAMVSGSGPASQIPAGFTYLGQFVDHDLTFDKTNVMLGENVSPADCCRRARRASTSTRSTARARRIRSRPSSTRPTAST